jgi:cold shock CspA family protein
MPTPTPHAKRAPKEAPPTEPARGTVLRFYPDRGFGFIRCTEGLADDVGHDFFFHYSGLAGGLVMEELEPGETVSFLATHVAKGRRAEQITREGAD